MSKRKKYSNEAVSTPNSIANNLSPPWDLRGWRGSLFWKRNIRVDKSDNAVRYVHLIRKLFAKNDNLKRDCSCDVVVIKLLSEPEQIELFFDVFTRRCKWIYHENMFPKRKFQRDIHSSPINESRRNES